MTADAVPVTTVGGFASIGSANEPAPASALNTDAMLAWARWGIASERTTPTSASSTENQGVRASPGSDGAGRGRGKMGRRSNAYPLQTPGRATAEIGCHACDELYRSRLASPKSAAAAHATTTV